MHKWHVADSNTPHGITSQDTDTGCSPLKLYYWRSIQSTSLPVMEKVIFWGGWGCAALHLLIGLKKKKPRIDKKQIRCSVPVGKLKTVCFIFEGEIDQTVKENVLTSKGLWLNWQVKTVTHWSLAHSQQITSRHFICNRWIDTSQARQSSSGFYLGN